MLLERDFCERIRSLGGELYIAGGWVRDLVIGRPSHDKDYVVCGLDDTTLTAAFAARSAGRAFPVFLIEVDGVPREVALARTERKAGRGYRGFIASFSPDTTIEEDLYRRDTRMNSMALRLPDMTLIDPFGGRRDIELGRISATSEHFRDDPVRSLRAARQAAELGFDVAPNTIGLMGDTREELACEPGERVLGEIRKALGTPAPAKFFTTLKAADLLRAVLPEIADLCGVEQPLPWHRGLDAFEHTMEVLTRTSERTTEVRTRFAALVHDIGKGMTPREVWPHHYDHPALGLDVLERMNSRMTLPKSWLRFARFVVSKHMDIPRVRAPGKIFDLLSEIRRHDFSAREIAAVIAADKGTAPPWLIHADELTDFLRERQRVLTFPPSLPPSGRSEWLRERLASALADRLRQLSR